MERVDALSVKPPRISKETHLLKWLRDVERGVHENEARGKSGDAQYASLMNLRKREECPYTDGLNSQHERHVLLKKRVHKPREQRRKTTETSRGLLLVVLTPLFTLVHAQRWVRLAREADFTND